MASSPVRTASRNSRTMTSGVGTFSTHCLPAPLEGSSSRNQRRSMRRARRRPRNSDGPCRLSPCNAMTFRLGAQRPRAPGNFATRGDGCPSPERRGAEVSQEGPNGSRRQSSPGTFRTLSTRQGQFTEKFDGAAGRSNSRPAGITGAANGARKHPAARRSVSPSARIAGLAPSRSQKWRRDASCHSYFGGANRVTSSATSSLPRCTITLTLSPACTSAGRCRNLPGCRSCCRRT